MTSAFRDVDVAEVDAFAKHVKMAQVLLDHLVAIQERIEGMLVGAPHEGSYRDLQQQARTAWVDAWAHIHWAREIAKRYGRDVSGVDRAHRQARQTWGHGEYFELVRSSETGKVVWRSAPRTPARAAIAALRAAMPEVVITKPPPATATTDISRSRVWLWAVAASAAGVAAWMAM